MRCGVRNGVSARRGRRGCVPGTSEAAAGAERTLRHEQVQVRMRMPVGERAEALHAYNGTRRHVAFTQ